MNILEELKIWLRRNKKALGKGIVTCLAFLGLGMVIGSILN